MKEYSARARRMATSDDNCRRVIRRTNLYVALNTWRNVRTVGSDDLVSESNEISR
jgi:hypothetical protein